MKTKTASASPKHIRTEEILKCGTDPVYFMNRYTKISHADKGLIPFHTFPFQQDCLKAFMEYRYNIINKSRQLGISTITAAYALWLCLFQREKNILVVATKLETAKIFMTRVKTIYKSLPPWLVLPKETINTVKEIAWSNGSRIKATPTSQDAGRGESLSLLIIDEAAHIEGINELWLGIQPSLSTGGSVIMLSTPAGVGSLFHKLWDGAQNGTNDFNPIELPWHVHPERDEDWFQHERRALFEAYGEQGVAQELLCLGGNTKIVTYDGCKEIKNIKIGDKVLTHKGRFRRVTKLYKHRLREDEKMFTVSTPGNRMQPIHITDNHPILSFLFKVSKGDNNKERFIKLLDSGGVSAQFENLHNISKWKYEKNHTRRLVYGCLFPHVKFDTICNSEKMKRIDMSALGVQCTEVSNEFVHYFKQNRDVRTNRFVEIDYDLGRLVGLFAAEGHKEQNRIGFAFHHNEYNTLGKFVRDYLSKMGATYHDNYRKYSKRYTILSCNKFLKNLLSLFVTSGNARTKHYNFDNLLSTNPEFIRGVLSGHFEGDGDHPIKGYLDNKLKVVSKSPKMLYQLKTLMSLYGLYPRLGFFNNELSYLEIDGLRQLKPNNRNIHYLTVRVDTKHLLDKPTSRTLLVEQQYFTGAIQWHELDVLSEYGETNPLVYNIEVEEDNSYIADSLVVHNCSFSASGNTFLNAREMEKLFKKIKPPVAQFAAFGHTKKDIWVWEYAKANHKYILSADVARGDGEDFSAFQIIDTNEDEAVCEYRGKIPPDNFAELLVTMASKYNMAVICCEKNSIGVATNLKLKELNYPNVFYDKLQKNAYMTYSTSDAKELTPGFETNARNKILILSQLEEVLRKGTVKTYSERFYKELQTFIWKNSKPNPVPMKGYHDDLIMSLAIGISLYDVSGKATYHDDEMARALLAGMSVSRNTMDAMARVDQHEQMPISRGSIGNPNERMSPKYKSNSQDSQDYNDPFWREFKWVLDD